MAKKALGKDHQKAKIDDLENKWKRAVADYLNLEKRIEKEKKFLIDLASAQLMEKLLPVWDELEICSRHLKDQGLKITIDKFWQVLSSEGLNEIEAEEKEFDPEIMEAVEVVPGVKNKVIEVVARGFKINDRVLRPAKVKVGSGNNKETANSI